MRECVTIGQDLLEDILAECKAPSAVILTDTTIASLYPRLFTHPRVYAMAPGESSKTRSTVSAVHDWMLSRSIPRGCTIIAVGGGVVTDLSGFIAATYMRGVARLVLVPTTLLAMVDASLGGKNGCNAGHAKNMLGTFRVPEHVYIHLQFLDTLDPRQYRSGLAEVVKIAAVLDAALFEKLESSIPEILARDPGVLLHIIGRAVDLKLGVVAEDLTDLGAREVLNFGHTIGHAVEVATPDTLHGEAVSLGMILESRLGARNGAIVSRLAALLHSLGLPVALDPHSTPPAGTLVTAMAKDKKIKPGTSCKRVVVVSTLGKASVVPFTDEQLLLVLSPGISLTRSLTPVPPAVVTVPGSKSLTNRLLVLAALSSSPCLLQGVLCSEDTSVMLAGLRALGVGISWMGNDLRVEGGAAAHTPHPLTVYIANSGTSARFLACIAAFVRPVGALTTLTGNSYMHSRPFKHLGDALQGVGVGIEYLEQPDCLPVRIHAARYTGQDLRMDARVSSQFVSGALMALGALSCSATITLLGDPVSKSYIDMTISCMSQFGVSVQSESCSSLGISATTYTSPSTVQVEGDASTASYWMALAVLQRSKITLRNQFSGVQGDADFPRILSQLCGGHQLVTQTPQGLVIDATHLAAVTGCDTLDMSGTSDCFMTAAVVASTAPGRTRLTGISTQRLKECDRLGVMVRELQRLGVRAVEHDDGIEVFGVGDQHLHGVLIDCEADHRVAMSFGVLGASLAGGLAVAAPESVEKTYPDFWSELKRVSKVCLSPYTRAPDTIVVLGMRGAGKSTLSARACHSLALPLLDVDALVEHRAGCSISTIVETMGWDAFREMEAQALHHALRAGAAVVVCGGGIVESSLSRSLLAPCRTVVWVHRDLDDIRTDLSSDPSRPPLELVPSYTRREPYYRALSQYDFHIQQGDRDWGTIAQEFTGLIHRLTTRATLHTLPVSFFVCLTGPVASIASVPEFMAGADAVELRVDLLPCTAPEYVCEQVVELRRRLALAGRWDTPIIFTYRSVAQGGNGADSRAHIQGLVHLALRLVVDYIDYEVGSRVSIPLSSHSITIGSRHFLQPVSSATLCQAIDPRADLIKLVSTAHAHSDCLTLLQVSNSIPTPHIAIAMGQKGILTRVLNQCMTPVRSPSMAGAAPGQLTLASIMEQRVALGMVDPKHYLFGTAISRSMSPALHRAGFTFLGLDPFYTFELRDTSDVSSLRQCLHSPGFNGAAVTMPFKVAIMSELDAVSDAARAIGAVNTVYCKDGHLLGDNTDWQAIHVLTKNLSMTTALVLGAGGAARAAVYALQHAGYTVSLWNRSGAGALVQEFGVQPVHSLDQADPVDLIVNTVSWKAELVVPATLLHNTPTVFDANYLPKETALTLQAREHHCTVILGLDMLLEQALVQHHLWTGRPAPRSAMRDSLI